MENLITRNDRVQLNILSTKWTINPLSTPLRYLTKYLQKKVNIKK